MPASTQFNVNGTVAEVVYVSPLFMLTVEGGISPPVFGGVLSVHTPLLQESHVYVFEAYVLPEPQLVPSLEGQYSVNVVVVGHVSL